MEANELGTLGLITVTFAMILVVDDLRYRRFSRRPVAKRVYASSRTPSQALSMVDARRS